MPINNLPFAGFGSMADINKTLVRSQSTQSLNTTKAFHGNLVSAPKVVADHNPMSVPNSDTIDIDNAVKLTADELSKHNLLGVEIEMRLNSNQNTEKSHQFFSNDINQVYKTSFERLKKFCEEVQKIQSSKLTEFDNDTSLTSLDQNLLDLMKKQSEVSNCVCERLPKIPRDVLFKIKIRFYIQKYYLIEQYCI